MCWIMCAVNVLVLTSILIDAKNSSSDFIILFASSLHKSSHGTSNDHFQSYFSTSQEMFVLNAFK